MRTRPKDLGAKDSTEALDAFGFLEGRVGSSVSGERAIDTDVGSARGTLIADRYRLGDQIGHGGMSRVYAARDLITQRDVAIKIVSFERGEREELEIRFRREVEVAMQLRGPAFVEVFDHAIRIDCAYLTMELLEGESLQSYLSREGRLDRHGTLEILRGVSEGIGAAHALCIVHRDLKPANIFLRSGGQGRRIRLIDFGIARDLWTNSTLTKTGAILGSPHYVSPEQALAEEIDHRTDLWSLGVILFRCLTGSRPFDGKLSQLVMGIVKDKHPLPSKLVPSLPLSVDAFFERALAKKPAHRFQDVHEMLAAFEAVVAEWHVAGAHPHATVTPMRGIARVVKVPARVDERVSERTTTAAESYESYAALVSTERISGFPTVQVDSPLLTGPALPSSAPPVLASDEPRIVPVLDDEPRSPWVAAQRAAEQPPVTRDESIRVPGRGWDVSIGAAMLILLIGIVIWIVSR